MDPAQHANRGPVFALGVALKVATKLGPVGMDDNGWVVLVPCPPHLLAMAGLEQALQMAAVISREGVDAERPGHGTTGRFLNPHPGEGKGLLTISDSGKAG